MTLERAQPGIPSRRCPACQSEQVLHAGQVFGGEGLIKAQHQCEKCGTAWKGVQKVCKGSPCPNCYNQTLHRVKTLNNGQSIRRCGLCDYSGIEPAAS